VSMEILQNLLVNNYLIQESKLQLLVQIFRQA